MSTRVNPQQVGLNHEDAGQSWRWRPFRAPPPPTRPQQLRGTIWIISGIEAGYLPIVRAYHAIRAAGATAAIRVFNWQRPGLGVFNLIALRRNRQRAETLARNIQTQLAEYPRAPIDVVAYSGGAAIAVFAAEALPAAALLRNLVLVHPALSPTYDLNAAASRCSGKLVVYHSPRDVLVDGLGTLVFGTMDRSRCIAAGNRGFDLDTALSRDELRSKVVQHAWSPQVWRDTGHYGGHLGMLTFRWNMRYVARYVLSQSDVDQGRD